MQPHSSCSKHIADLCRQQYYCCISAECHHVNSLAESTYRQHALFRMPRPRSWLIYFQPIFFNRYLLYSSNRSSSLWLGMAHPKLSCRLKSRFAFENNNCSSNTFAYGNQVTSISSDLQKVQLSEITVTLAQFAAATGPIPCNVP